MVFILIPGASSAAAKGIFDAIRKELVGEKTIVLSSASEEELQKTISELKAANSKLVLVGKSAGGRLSLEHQLKHKDAKALVLLAPAIKADKKFSEIKIPTLIVHGTTDDVVPLENSRELNKIILNSKLVEVEGANHGYTGKEKEAAEAVTNFIARNI